MGFRWAEIVRFASLGICAAGLTGCAALFGEPQTVDGGLKPQGQEGVTYGDGSVTIELTPRPELRPDSGGKIMARAAMKPRLLMKPGDERLTATAPAIPPRNLDDAHKPEAAALPAPAIIAPKAPDVANEAYQPGWSIENSSKALGVVFNGKRLDPSGAINQGLLRQALARVEREGGADRLEQIAVVDFSLPADKPRWFFVNLKNGSVRSKFVSHGHAKRLCRKGGCGANFQAGFSLSTPAVSASANTDATSVGLYKVLGLRPEGGKFPGPTVALAGLDPSNETAQRRGIIIHQNPRYFDPKRRLFGRSQGCFVFGPDDLPDVVQTLAPGSFIYAGMPSRATAAAPAALQGGVN